MIWLRLPQPYLLLRLPTKTTPHFIVSGLVFGAITCLVISLKMMASNKVKIDRKNPTLMGDFGGGGEF